MKELLYQAIRFFGLSGIGWLLDFSTYIILGTFSQNLVLNNTISSWVGVTFVFLFATRKIFQNYSKMPLHEKYVLYLLYQVVLIYFISKLLAGINSWILATFYLTIVQQFSGIMAKIIVTPVTMVLNFIVMKNVIEKL